MLYQFDIYQSNALITCCINAVSCVIIALLFEHLRFENFLYNVVILFAINKYLNERDIYHIDITYAIANFVFKGAVRTL